MNLVRALAIVFVAALCLFSIPRAGDSAGNGRAVALAGTEIGHG
jgi:hypothetical protein